MIFGIDINDFWFGVAAGWILFSLGSVLISMGICMVIEAKAGRL